MLKKTDEAFDHPNADGELQFHTFGDAVETILEESDWLPEYVDITRFARTEAKMDGMAESILEHTLESLDIDNGCEEPTEPSDRLKNAANEFVKVLHEEYVPWAMVPRETETVDVRQWVVDTWGKERMWSYVALSEAAGDNNDIGIPVPVGGWHKQDIDKDRISQKNQIPLLCDEKDHQFKMLPIGDASICIICETINVVEYGRYRRA